MEIRKAWFTVKPVGRVFGVSLWMPGKLLEIRRGMMVAGFRAIPVKDCERYRLACAVIELDGHRHGSGQT
jgi:hypothetical protein